jgi:hypothetical protein
VAQPPHALNGGPGAVVDLDGYRGPHAKRGKNAYRRAKMPRALRGPSPTRANLHRGGWEIGAGGVARNVVAAAACLGAISTGVVGTGAFFLDSRSATRDVRVHAASAGLTFGTTVRPEPRSTSGWLRLRGAWSRAVRLFSAWVPVHLRYFILTSYYCSNNIYLASAARSTPTEPSPGRTFADSTTHVR